MAGQLKNNEQFEDVTSYWYRQRVLDKIFEIYYGESGSVKSKTLLLPDLIENQGAEVFKASIIFFGSWKNALQVGGLLPVLDKLSSNRNNDEWSLERVKKQIQLLNQTQIELSSGFIRHVYPELYHSALNKEIYGSWIDALEDAEVDIRYLKSIKNKIWTVKQIFNTLIDYDFAYGNIQSGMVRIQNPTLYSASRRYFKSWQETVAIAGLNLNRNLIKVAIEPLRNYIVIEYLKKIFEIMGCPYQEHNLGISESKMDIYGLDIPELEEIPRVVIETSDGNNKICNLASYRSWGFGIEHIIYDLMSTYKNIEIYSSVGELRSWVDENIKFKNLNMFFSELIDKGRDDIISDLSLMARGGIPKQYQDRYEGIMKSFRRSIKEKK
jgi:hypothetical protein